MARATRWGLLLWATLFAVAGCGRSARSTGSNTNWLGCANDSDCEDQGPGLECANGVCLRPVAAGGSSGASETGGSGPGDGAVGGGGSAGSATMSGTSGSAGKPPGGDTLAPAGPRLGVSSTHACIVASRDGGAVAYEVWCWGDGLYGQIASIQRDVTRPQLVQGVAGVASIALSSEHTCALTQAGDVYCWGKNDLGQIGGPSAADDTCPDYVLDRSGYYACQPTPTRVEGVASAVRVAVSSGRSCALLASGRLKCWGDVGSFSSWASSVSDARSVALGAQGACVTTSDGDVSCSFALPNGVPTSGVAQVLLASDAAAATGLDFMCLLDMDGVVRCLGDDTLGELGRGGTIEESAVPPTLGDATAIALGAAHACALGNDGVVRCWGRNSAGAVGSPPLTSPSCGYDTCERSPLDVFGLPRVDELAAGGDRVCAFATSGVAPDTNDRLGTLWCWGPETSRSGYARRRMTGPWEEGAIACEEQVHAVDVDASNLVAMADHACLTDGDCVLVSLDLSCSHSCAFESASRAGADVLSAGIQSEEAELCSGGISFTPCGSPEVTCPINATRPICLNGQCTQDDPMHNGCDDACGCEAVREASLSVWKDECSGFDLWPIVGLACGACQDSTSAVVVGNRGGRAFQGQAVVSFEPIEGDTADVPEPLTVTLDLAPGAVSQAIHVPSKSPGTATLRVTAEGDCQPLNDASTEVSLPSPANPCD
jgi:hypothetical protein